MPFIEITHQLRADERLLASAKLSAFDLWRKPYLTDTERLQLELIKLPIDCAEEE